MRNAENEADDDIIWPNEITLFGQAVAVRLRRLVRHRGIGCEKRIVKSFGEDRMAQLYSGVEPTFVEILDLAEFLEVSFTSLMPIQRELSAELRDALAELVEFARRYEDADQERLTSQLKALIAHPMYPDFPFVDVNALPNGEDK
jgi:hypothetical protein